MELTLSNYMKFRTWKAVNCIIHDAAIDKHHPYHKMVTAKKMSRKRLRGLLIATGAPASSVDLYLRILNKNRIPYITCWNYNMRSMVERIYKSKKIEMVSTMLAQKGMTFDDVNVEEIKTFIIKKYEAFKQLVESHPEITSAEAADKARNAHVYSLLEDKDGNRILREDKLDTETVNQLSAIMLWYMFCDYCAEQAEID